MITQTIFKIIKISFIYFWIFSINKFLSVSINSSTSRTDTLTTLTALFFNEHSPIFHFPKWKSSRPTILAEVNYIGFISNKKNQYRMDWESFHPINDNYVRTNIVRAVTMIPLFLHKTRKKKRFGTAQRWIIQLYTSLCITNAYHWTYR